MRYIINIDWLSYCVKGSISEDYITTKIPTYQVEMTLLKDMSIKLLKHNNRQFKHIYEVYYQNTLFAVVQANPFSDILDNDLMIVKCANYYLYYPTGIKMFEDFCRLMGWKVHNVSRVDICADFEQFQHIHPQEFIQKFASGEYRHIGRAKGTLHFRKKGIGLLQYNGLKFGSAESEVSCYLYNKSLELQEVKDKPYIQDKWNAAGLNGQVWRLEVSIKSGAMRYADRRTGEEVHITSGLLNNMGQVTRVYHAFVQKYFEFIVYRKGITNITREPRVQLFGNVERLDRWIIRNVRASDKADKIAIKRIYQSSRRNNGGEIVSNPIATIQMAREYAQSVNLEKWYNEHIDKWEDEEIIK